MYFSTFKPRHFPPDLYIIQYRCIFLLFQLLHEEGYKFRVLNFLVFIHIDHLNHLLDLLQGELHVAAPSENSPQLIAAN